MSANGKKNFDRKESEDILGQAARRQLVAEGEGFSREALVEAANEVGIQEEHVLVAAAGAAPAKVSLRIDRPGPTISVLFRAILYGCVSAFSVVALVRSGFGLVAWLGTLPFLAVGLFSLVRVIVSASTSVAIEIGDGRFSVTTARLGAPEVFVANAADVIVTGPLNDRMGIGYTLFSMMFIRFACASESIEIGHGLSDVELRRILRAVGPHVRLIEE